ncbi:PH domain-containing protein [Mucilaginibacter sp.]
MKFYSRKGFIIVAIIIFLIIMIIVSLWGKVYPAFFILILALSYLVWMWFDTYYMIEGYQFLYRSALVKGSININTIVEVVKNKVQTSGTKPALSTKGITIKYNKWDDIFISPVDIDQFISALKNVNPDIKISE